MKLAVLKTLHLKELELFKLKTLQFISLPHNNNYYKIVTINILVLV